MRIISSIMAALVRLLSASAVRTALSATLTTPLPAVAFHAVDVSRQQRLVVLVLAAGQAGDDTTELRDVPPPTGLGGPGPGWG